MVMLPVPQKGKHSISHTSALLTAQGQLSAQSCPRQQDSTLHPVKGSPGPWPTWPPAWDLGAQMHAAGGHHRHHPACVRPQGDWGTKWVLTTVPGEDRECENRDPTGQRTTDKRTSSVGWTADHNSRCKDSPHS